MRRYPFIVKSCVGALALALLAFFFGGCQSRFSSQTVASPQRAAAGANSETQALPTDRSPLKLPLASPKIVVRKAQRRLLLFSGDKLVRTYRIGLGLSPVGDKVRQGDRRTPEGEFYIFTKNSKSAFYLSLGLSYPNAAHAERGLRDGLITKSQYDAIRRALKAKKAPPQNTALGETFISMATVPRAIGPGAVSRWRTKTSANSSTPFV